MNKTGYLEQSKQSQGGLGLGLLIIQTRTSGEQQFECQTYHSILSQDNPIVGSSSGDYTNISYKSPFLAKM